MHPDIEKLIKIAKETGGLTEKQKEIILRKADALGEDVVEVEMILESAQFNQKSNNSSAMPEKRMKCPNCGAIISDISLNCPECGYIFKEENKSSIDFRRMIEELQNKLSEVSSRPLSSNLFKQEFEKKTIVDQQVSLIRTFNVPVTKECLSQFLEFASSNYTSITDIAWDQQQIKSVWLGRALQAYKSLSRLGSDDSSTKSLLDKYSYLTALESKNTKRELNKLSNFHKIGLGCLVLVIMVIICVAMCSREISKGIEKANVNKMQNSETTTQ